MGARGPGEPPPVVRRRAARVKRQERSQRARAQQNAYVSQGRSVERQARQQRTQRAARQVARGTQPARPLARKPVRPQVVRAPKPLARTKRPPRVQRAQRTTDVPRDIREAQDRPFRELRQRATALSTVRALTDKPVRPRTALIASPDTKIVRQLDPDETRRKRAAVAAPALKVLDQTMRPTYAIAGGARAAIKGEDVTRAVSRGARLKDRYTGSDVLKAAGVKGPLAHAAGFALDVAADPTTYVTFGAGSVAKRAAQQAGAKAARQAAKKGMSEAGQKTVARQAAKRAAEKAGRGSGVTVSVGGREVPAVRRGTAAAGRAVTAPARKVAPAAARSVPASGRRAVREIAPRVRPAEVSGEQFQQVRAAARTARATQNNAEQNAVHLATKLQRRLKPDEYAAVIDAIERNDLQRLPSQELAQAAHRLRSELKGARRVSRRAGVGADKGVGEGGEFLNSAAMARLRRTIKAEPEAQARRASQLERHERRAQVRALLAEQESTLRGQGRAAVTREQEIAQTRRAVVAARKRLRVELAKPVTKRRGVAVLESRVRQAEQEWKRARRPARERIPEQPPVGRRAGQAAERYERRAADVQLAQRRTEAAQRIPARSRTESHEQYLRRLVKYADRHDLPLVKSRATKLLASIPKDVARGYFPRDFDARVLKQLGLSEEQAATRTVRSGGTGRKVAPTTAGFARSEVRALRSVNPEREAAGKVPFSTNVPLVTLNHLKQAARATSQGEFAKEMTRIGRKVASADDLQPGEALYKLGYRGRQFGLHEVKDLPKRPTKGGQYVALNRTLLEEMQGSTSQIRAGTQAGRAFDRATGAFKRVATATPGFHVRNIIGDVQQSYLATPGHQIPRNMAQAGKAVRRASEQARELRPAATDATIKVAGEHQNLDRFLADAKRHGVMDTGYIGRELRDLGGQASGSAKRVRKGRGQAIDRWMTNRENLMRLATYKAGLDRGLKPAEAADLANRFHVDYGELSELERRALRRVLPFYTWTARSLPVAAHTLVTRPGKYATIEKAREETGKAFTGEDEQRQRSRMTDTVARQIPVVIRVAGEDQAISASIPATLLNELPTGASREDLNAWIDELGRFTFGMVNPAIRSPFELRANRVLYTKQDIEKEDRPLVAAPAWVKYLPSNVKQELEITPNYQDKRTGKRSWGWRGRADWLFRQIPGAPQQVSSLASGGRPGQPTSPAAAVSGALGVRVDSLGAAQTKRATDVRKLKRLADLNRRAGALNQQGVNSDNPTPEYKRLRREINALTKQVRPRKPATGGGGSLFDEPASGGGGSLFD